jgi:DNA adenine methylase
LSGIKPLIKYVGNKHRSASAIIAAFPTTYRTYFEPFAGSLAVLGHLRPQHSVVADIQRPLIDMWRLVQSRPSALVASYRSNWERYRRDKLGTYEAVKASYNASPNPHDFLFISRTCYGGVMRFRKKDGGISTPESFAARIELWHRVVQRTEFVHGDFATIVGQSGSADIVYCDPPYTDSQRILYGAQDFTLTRLFSELQRAKDRGAFVALSIDGVKKSGLKIIPNDAPTGLFEVECHVSLGGSMLKRFWRDGLDVQDERVKDRLLISREAVRSQPDLFHLEVAGS